MAQGRALTGRYAFLRRKTVSSPGRTRTYDPAINSRLLYQLSYRGSKCSMLIYEAGADKGTMVIGAGLGRNRVAGCNLLRL